MSCKKCKCKVCSCIKNEVPKIAVNGIVQNPNENDVVNIKVPTKTSQLINDSGFGQGNGGGTGGQKIEDIRFNGELVGEQPIALTDKRGVVLQSTRVEDVSTADATDLASALTLVNELKAKLNEKLITDRNSGQQAT